jgi:hypothetical protein
MLFLPPHILPLRLKPIRVILKVGSIIVTGFRFGGHIPFERLKLWRRVVSVRCDNVSLAARALSECAVSNPLVDCPVVLSLPH